MDLYQVQLETSNDIYCFEICTDDFDAVEIAKRHLKSKHGEDCPFHVGGYGKIGLGRKRGVLKFRKGE